MNANESPGPKCPDCGGKRPLSDEETIALLDYHNALTRVSTNITSIDIMEFASIVDKAMKRASVHTLISEILKEQRRIVDIIMGASA